MSRNLGLFIALTLAAVPVAAQQETLVVTATRLPQPGFDLPAAIDAIAARVIREDNAQVNLSETLNRVPGIVVQNRQNYAQDLQISSRGFGARSTFGVRGVRLIADGIPATMPDGQGQAATFDLASAERIEVLRGPFASLYGNSSGGVIQVFTADGPPEPTLDVGFVAGSYGQRRGNLRFGGQHGDWNYILNASRFETDGYRDHSAAVREQVNAKVRTTLGPGQLTFVVNGLDQPDTQDPLGLTREDFEEDPRQVVPGAILFDTRKSIRQGQAGVVYDLDLSSTDSLQARAYYGDRQVVQFLAFRGNVPALSSGGVIDLDRNYGGVGIRWTRRLATLKVSAGVEHDSMDERRRGFVNEFGDLGDLRRDEDNEVSNTDFFVQAEWDLSPRWILSAGARHSRVKFVSDDSFVTEVNPDDSGSVTHRRTTPVAGIVFKASPEVNIYANAGEGFETPTFAELAYQPGGATGLNLDLEPAISRHYEVGVKARPASGLRVNAAVFRIETRDEIVTDVSLGGRTTFKNAARTLRKGLEISADAQLGAGVEASLAYTALSAKFSEDFTAGLPPELVPGGNRLPGVPASVLHAEVVWRPSSAFHVAAELHHAGKVYVNEENSDAADSYTVANLRAGFEQRYGPWRLREFVRVDNVTDRRYAGSVIVAEGNGRFFEPAPGRNYLAGVEISRVF